VRPNELGRKFHGLAREKRRLDGSKFIVPGPRTGATTGGNVNIFDLNQPGVRVIAIDRRGSCRLTFCIGPWAIKVARNATGRRCNRYEAHIWQNSPPFRREMLCPALILLPFGFVLVMPRATSLSEDEAEHLRATDGFPDWDYMPNGESCPFEYKASDWGRLPDGRLVALDYSSNTLSDPAKLELAIQAAIRRLDEDE
jgi:hypothetical protein